MDDRYDTCKYSGNANETDRDLRSWKKLFRSDENCDDDHHERIHDSESELNCHCRCATGTTLRTLFAANPKTFFMLQK